MDLKNALLIPAIASIAVAVATVAIADPNGEGQIADHASAPDLHGTVTVTATIAPNQCQPVAGGPTATEAADTGQEPVGTANAAPQPVGATGSRFDPYTCTPVPADASGTEKPTTAGSGSGSGSAGSGHDAYTPTLQPFPNSGGTGSGPAHGPLSEPTTTAMLPGPATTPPYRR